jgi:hypothetical protein
MGRPANWNLRRVSPRSQSQNPTASSLFAQKRNLSSLESVLPKGQGPWGPPSQRGAGCPVKDQGQCKVGKPEENRSG